MIVGARCINKAKPRSSTICTEEMPHITNVSVIHRGSLERLFPGQTCVKRTVQLASERFVPRSGAEQLHRQAAPSIARDDNVVRCIHGSPRCMTGIIYYLMTMSI